MKRVTVYDKDGNAINCWPDTAKKLIALGYSEDEPKKAKSRKPKSPMKRLARMRSNYGNTRGIGRYGFYRV